MTPNDAATEASRHDSEHTVGIGVYAAAVASGQPTPGGGSVVGVVAALAAALGAMVCRFTPSLSDGDGASALAELDRWRDEMLALANADAAAYGAYRAAAALPKDTDAERGRRRQAMQAALIESTEVPLAIARACARLHVLLTDVAAAGNPHLRSDAAIGVLLADAALRGSLINVRGNVRLIKDAVTAEGYRAAADELEQVLADQAVSGA